MRTVEIFDEENSIVIDDQYTTDTLEFFPDKKIFKIDSSIKDDAFYNYLTYEYKISANPLELQYRLVERSYEPPKEYAVKDGVVLESEITKGKEGYFLEDAKKRIADLKKQIEWEKIDVLGNYEVNLYILSLHPEIVSKEEYRKFLRQSVEKIKAGVLKVEESVKQDTRGLEISTGEYGKSIWYPNTEAEKKEMDDYYDLPEEKRKGTDYAKKLEYIEKFNNSLFKESSPKYAGISENEFRNSSKLLEYVENLLDKKETAIKKVEAVPQQKSNTNKIISVLIYLLTVFFIILKLTDSIDWNWFAVISPVLIWEVFGFIIGFLRALSK